MLVIILIVASCNNNNDPHQQFMDEVSESVQEFQHNQKQKEKDRMTLFSMVEKRIHSNPEKGILFVDSILDNMDMMGYEKRELLSHTSDVLYKDGQYRYSLNQCFKTDKMSSTEDPLIYSYKARSYIKIGKKDSAEYLLLKASEINFDFEWLLGNFYEIIGFRDSAIAVYNNLYERSNFHYSYCLDRIDSINLGYPLYQELDFSIIHNQPKIVF